MCSLMCGGNAVCRREELTRESGKILGTVIRKFVMHKLPSVDCHNKSGGGGRECPHNTGKV